MIRQCVFSFSVFDDGDEKTLRRSSLCLKGERHFAESEVSGRGKLSYAFLPPAVTLPSHSLLSLARRWTSCR